MSESKIKINYGRNFLYLNSLYSFFIKKKRNEIFEILKKNFKLYRSTKILDVGTTPSLEPHENMILNKFKMCNSRFEVNNSASFKLLFFKTEVLTNFQNAGIVFCSNTFLVFVMNCLGRYFWSLL